MLEKLLPWIGGIFATIGLICLFFDLVNSIRKRNRRALNIVGLIVLAISVIGYLLTDVVFKNSVWPPKASFVWIALFWVYVILTAIGTVGDVRVYRKHRRETNKKRIQASDPANNRNQRAKDKKGQKAELKSKK